MKKYVIFTIIFSFILFCFWLYFACLFGYSAGRFESSTKGEGSSLTAWFVLLHLLLFAFLPTLIGVFSEELDTLFIFLSLVTLYLGWCFSRILWFLQWIANQNHIVTDTELNHFNQPFSVLTIVITVLLIGVGFVNGICICNIRYRIENIED